MELSWPSPTLSCFEVGLLENVATHYLGTVYLLLTNRDKLYTYLEFKLSIQTIWEASKYRIRNIASDDNSTQLIILNITHRPIHRSSIYSVLF